MKKSSIYWVIGIVVVLSFLISLRFIFPSNKTKPVTNVNPEILPGIQTGEAPWQPELVHLRDRLGAIGLPALNAEGTDLHIHQHLDIFIDEKKIDVPAGIGINEPAQFISPIHTHDTDGLIHVESPTIQDFTLGQFFDIWGVRFNQTCIGGYCNTGKNHLLIFINGREIGSDPRVSKLEPHEEIAIYYGPSDAPQVPSSYQFAPGL